MVKSTPVKMKRVIEKYVKSSRSMYLERIFTRYSFFSKPER
jgi:hypothetical protein